MAGLRDDPGLWLLLHLRPPGDRRHDVSGRCAVCGAEGRLVRNGWMLSRDLRKRYGSALADRESLFCGRCGCSLRVRRIAEVLIGLYGTAAVTLAELVREDAFRALRIAEINSIGRMHPILAEAPGLVHVEYPEEDIQALSWADGAFDLVLTSETLEHVPDPRRALRETFRVLRPGGRHIFTVPVDASLALTRSRDGLPPEHHGRGGGPFALVTRKADMLVHTDFGGDLPDVVRAEGFDVATDGEGIELVVVATRPEAVSGRALVTGVGGQDGALLARLLVDRGYHVAGIVRREPQAYAESLGELRDEIELVPADLLDRKSLAAALRAVRPGEVYNLAAPSFVPRSWDEPILTAEFAAVGATSMLEAIREVDDAIRFYQASSSEIFGEPRETPQTEETRRARSRPTASRRRTRTSSPRATGAATACSPAAGSSTTTSRRSGPSTSCPGRSRGPRPPSRWVSSGSSSSATCRRVATGVTPGITCARCG